MIISIIAAMAKNRVIGKDGTMPWHIPEDLRRFRELTMGHTIIMGRRTFEQIGHPLPGRRNIILTRQLHYGAAGCLVLHSIADALGACADVDEVFICGGGDLYRQTISLADRIYLTVVDGEYAGDTFFPPVPREFAEIQRTEAGPCTFLLLHRENAPAL